MQTRYRVRGHDSVCRTLEITQQVPGGYMVRLRCETAWNSSHTVEFISESLFRMCLRTGYLQAESETLSRAVKAAAGGPSSVELPA